MNVQELKQEIQKKCYEVTFGDDDNVYMTRRAVLNLVDSLEEVKKPVVPDYVISWYEANKDNLEKALQEEISKSNNMKSLEESNKENDIVKWLLNPDNRPLQTIINMSQFGYKGEDEKRYVVNLTPGSFQGGYLKYEAATDNWFVTGIESQATQMTEREIKAIDKRYWPFAERTGEE